jgi:hypothetical protein
MNVEETVQNLHLNLEEADEWVKKNLNETGRVIEVVHYMKNKKVKTMKDDAYVDPSVMSFTMDVSKYKKKK